MIHLLQNDPRVPSGYFGELLAEWKVDHRTVRLYDGEPLPTPAPGDGSILLGGYMGADEEQAYPHLRPTMEYIYDAIGARLPVLGICLGAQLLARAMGGGVHRDFLGERGTGVVFLGESAVRDPLLSGLSSPLPVLQWHRDSFELPPGGERLGWSPTCPNQIFRYGCSYGVQFHPEITGSTLSEWVLHNNAPRGVLKEFAADRKNYRGVARLLLSNFLKLCGYRSSRARTG